MSGNVREVVEENYDERQPAWQVGVVSPQGETTNIQLDFVRVLK